MPSPPEYVVVAGLSGAGRSTAANALEDLGWLVIDNLPPGLVGAVAQVMATENSGPQRLALVAGSRGYYEDLLPTFARMRDVSARLRVLFLDAPTDALLLRFDDTKRRHPLQGTEDEPLLDAIERERSLLEDVRSEADLVIDTGDLNPHELRARVTEALGPTDCASQMRTAVMSFGYKHGVPRDADLVFDCRFLPNPHWVAELRPRTGEDASVADYVLAEPPARQFMDDLTSMLANLLPAYEREGRAYLTIAFGCTGGRHRSVAVAQGIATQMGELGYAPAVRHRDLH